MNDKKEFELRLPKEENESVKSFNSVCGEHDMAKLWDMHDFGYKFIFDEQEYISGGYLFSSVHRFILNLKSDNKKFFCFGEVSRTYNLLIDLSDAEFAHVQLIETEGEKKVIKQITVNKNALLGGMFNSIEYFLNILRTDIYDEALTDYISRIKSDIIFLKKKFGINTEK